MVERRGAMRGSRPGDDGGIDTAIRRLRLVIESGIDEANRKRFAIGGKRQLHLASVEAASDIGFPAAIERDAHHGGCVALRVQSRYVFEMQDTLFRFSVKLEADALAPVQKIHQQRPSFPGRLHAAQRAAGFLKPFGFRTEAFEMRLQLAVEHGRSGKVLPHFVKRPGVHLEVFLCGEYEDES